MANGDAAAAAGLAVVAGTMDLRNGYDEINATRDMVANDKTTGTRRADQITTGVLNADRLPSIPESKVAASTRARGLSNNAGQLLWDGAGLWSSNANITMPTATISGTTNIGGPIFYPWGRANGISGGLGLYVRSDGVIGVSSSSRRFKKEIKAWTPDEQAILAMQVVEFRWKADHWQGSGPSPVEVGLIAEDLHDLGLTWLVFYDDDGVTPRGIHYEKIALALIPLVQNLATRVSALEAK
jgi:hypothetical protein